MVGNDGHTLNNQVQGRREESGWFRRKHRLSPMFPADKSDLKPGAKVIAFMKKLPDGSFETNRVSVGRDGLTPPM